jgi:hypothetical protein
MCRRTSSLRSKSAAAFALRSRDSLSEQDAPAIPLAHDGAAGFFVTVATTAATMAMITITTPRMMSMSVRRGPLKNPFFVGDGRGSSGPFSQPYVCWAANPPPWTGLVHAPGSCGERAPSMPEPSPRGERSYTLCVA